MDIKLVARHSSSLTCVNWHIRLVLKSRHQSFDVNQLKNLVTGMSTHVSEHRRRQSDFICENVMTSSAVNVQAWLTVRILWYSPLSVCRNKIMMRANCHDKPATHESGSLSTWQLLTSQTEANTLPFYGVVKNSSAGWQAKAKHHEDWRKLMSCFEDDANFIFRQTCSDNYYISTLKPKITITKALCTPSMQQERQG